jgi:hypothetical protein
MREQQADFVGVAGVRDVVELHDQDRSKVQGSKIQGWEMEPEVDYKSSETVER